MLVRSLCRPLRPSRHFRPKRVALRLPTRRPFAASAEEFVTAFNKGDAKKIGALWTTDCEYVDETGVIFRGRDAIEKEYARFFAANPGLKMETAISSVKIISGHAAIEDGQTTVKNMKGAIVSRAFYTTIHLKEGDKWLMASVRERAIPSVLQASELRKS